VRPVGAILDDEAIEIRFASGLKPENWNPGDYRVTDSLVLPDQTRALTLTGTLLPPGADRLFRRPPIVRASVSESEFTATEQVAWRFEANRITAAVRVGVRVRRGPLFQFGLRVPAGYTLARVNSSPEELVAYSGTAAGIATVEFARPLSVGQAADLTFEFRGPALGSLPPALPFPVFASVGATERVGVLGICPGLLWAIDPVPGTGMHPTAWFDVTEPRQPADATAAFRYRGGNPDGVLHLTPIRPEFTADTTTRIVPTLGGLVGTTTFVLRMQAGGLTALMLVESEGGATDRVWRVVGGGNAVVSAVVLPGQSLAQPLGSPAGWPGRFATAGAAREPGRVWLVRFARPVTGTVILETSATRELPKDAGTATLQELTDSFSRWVVPGATPAPEAAAPGASAPPVESRPAWSFSGLYLVSAVRSPSDVVVIFGGTVDSSAGTSLPIRLPAGAQVRAAGVGARWMEPGGCQLSPDGVLRLPMPASGSIRFEVRYRLPVEVPGPLGRVCSPEPGLPVEGSEVRRWWCSRPTCFPAGRCGRGIVERPPICQRYWAIRRRRGPAAWSCRDRRSRKSGSRRRAPRTRSESESRPFSSPWRGPAADGDTRSAGC
jgi:hypothetical protein